VVTGTLRFLIIVALVVAGAVVIAQFPDSSTTGLASGGSGSPSQTTSPPAQGGGDGNTGTNTGGGQTATVDLKGVQVAVYNGTTQTGLAADVAAVLVKKYHVKIDPQDSILNAPSVPVDLTVVYFLTPADKDAATTLADAYFDKRLPSPPKVQKLPDNTTAPPGTQVAVYLGMDYVNG
jgi:hypothetical protein